MCNHAYYVARLLCEHRPTMCKRTYYVDENLLCEGTPTMCGRTYYVTCITYTYYVTYITLLGRCGGSHLLLVIVAGVTYCSSLWLESLVVRDVTQITFRVPYLWRVWCGTHMLLIVMCLTLCEMV